MVLFTNGSISFEPMGIFGFSFRQTNHKNKWDQQTKTKDSRSSLYYYIPSFIEVGPLVPDKIFGHLGHVA